MSEFLNAAFIKLKAKGVCLIGNCPNPHCPEDSFTVSLVTNTFHCFGCLSEGDLFFKFNKITFALPIDFEEFRVKTDPRILELANR